MICTFAEILCRYPVLETWNEIAKFTDTEVLWEVSGIGDLGLAIGQTRLVCLPSATLPLA